MGQQPEAPVASTSASPTKLEKRRAADLLLKHDLTEPELINQLFNRTDGIVGLGQLVHRVVGSVFAQLEQLTEILPSKEDYQRKQLLVRFIEESRKHLARLLVAARWSAQARYIKRAQDVLGFLEQQAAHLSGTIDGIEGIRHQLTDVRLRNFDVSTALDVLTTGSFHGPPAVVREQYAGFQMLPDELVRETMCEVENMLKYRLAVEEDLPHTMKQYRIEDGKAYFEVKDLFQVCLTLTGEEEDPWLCLNVEFLPKADPPNPAIRDEILRLARTKLKRAPDPPMDQPDRPLRRLYQYLRDLSLDLRLERLANEAGRLAAETWSKNITARLSREDRQLVISYWTNVSPAPLSVRQSQPANIPRPPPPVPPRLIIAAMDRKATSQAYIAAGLDEAPQLETDLAWLWDPQMPLGYSSVYETLDVHEPIAHLLDTVTRKHMDSLCRQIIGDIVASEPLTRSGLNREPIERDGQLVGFREQVHPTLNLDVVIEQHSGRFRLQPQTEISASLRKYISGLEDDVNGLRDRFAAALLQIRALVTIENVETQAALAGLRILRISSLRQADQEKLGTSHHVMLLLPLVNAGLFHLLAVACPREGLKFALAAMQPPSEESPAWSASDMAWITTPKIQVITHVSVEHLAAYYRYASVRAAHLRLEQQLVSRLLPYSRYPAAVKQGQDPLDRFPSIVLRLDDVLPTANFAHRLVVIRAEYVLPAKPCRLAFYMRLSRITASLIAALPPNCTLDKTTKLLVARFADDLDEEAGGAFPAFLELLGLLARLYEVSR